MIWLAGAAMLIVNVPGSEQQIVKLWKRFPFFRRLTACCRAVCSSAIQTLSTGMSDQDSDGKAGSGHPSPSHARSLGALRMKPLEKLVNDYDWYNGGRPGFHERAVVSQYTTSASSAPRSHVNFGSDSSSMASAAASVRAYSPSQWQSYYAPSLANSYSTTTGTPSSVRTSRADFILQPPPLELDETGTTVIAVPKRVLDCPFTFLSCEYCSTDMSEWDTHCQSHFRGRLPRSIQCPFACHWSVAAESGRQAWEEYISHIEDERHGTDRVDTRRRPSPALIQQLYSAGVLSQGQVKELRQHGRFTEQGGYLHFGEGKQDRRRERGQKHR